MMKTTLKILSILLFAFGIVFAGWSLISLNSFFQAKGANRLPPAGSFIEGPDAFSFAILSDSGLRDEPLSAVIQDIKTKKVKFILHLGDQARRLSSNHFEHILQDLDRELGETPFYAVPGNHDVLFKKTGTLKYYQRAFGQPNYWFSYGNTLFIALNTAFAEFPEKDQEWLSNVLKHMRPMFKNCILVMHVTPEDPRPGKSYAMYKDQDKLKEIIAKYKFNAVICGHIHEFNESTWADIPLYIVPTSGQEMRGRTTQFGYLLCTLSADGKLQVQHIEVTDKTGRDYLRYFLSTGLDGITAAGISFALLISAFIALLISSKIKPEKKAVVKTNE